MNRSGGVFITGGTGALGRVLAARFLDEDYAVAVSYRGERGWETLAAERPEEVRAGRLTGFEADLREPDSIGEAMERAASGSGGLRVLVHAAGGYAGGAPVETVEPPAVREMFELNLLSAFWAVRAALGYVKRSPSGRILFISSRGALEPQAGSAAYACAKLGLHALVAALTRELKGTGCTANAVLPGVMDTPANRIAMPNARFDTWVRPEAVASVLAFLASEAAGSVSGALVPVFGGAS